jgi:hypothetical protein
MFGDPSGLRARTLPSYSGGGAGNGNEFGYGALYNSPKKRGRGGGAGGAAVWVALIVLVGACGGTGWLLNSARIQLDLVNHEVDLMEQHLGSEKSMRHYAEVGPARPAVGWAALPPRSRAAMPPRLPPRWPPLSIAERAHPRIPNTHDHLPQTQLSHERHANNPEYARLEQEVQTKQAEVRAAMKL